MRLGSGLGVSGSDQSQDNNDGEDQKEQGKDDSNLVEDGVNSVGCVISRHGDMYSVGTIKFDLERSIWLFLFGNYERREVF